MVTKQQNGIPSVDDIEEGVRAAYAAEGYVQDDGVTPDKRKVLGRVSEIVRADPVTGKRDRNAKAIRKGALTKLVFPSQPGPDAWARQDSPRLAEEVWKKLVALTWSQTTTGANSKLQEMVTRALGNSYLLCRTKVGTTDLVDAVYITHDRECVKDDYLGPRDRGMERTSGTYSKDYEMAMRLMPENAKTFERQANRAMRAAGVAVGNRLKLAIESANGTEPDQAATEPDEGDEI